MNQTSFISAFKQAIPETEWPRLLSALRQEPLILETLQTQFGYRVLEQYKADQINPARLALLALDYPAPLEALTAIPAQPVAPPFDQPEPALPPHSIAPKLATAAIQALKLRAEWHRAGGWEHLADRSQEYSHTTLVCCYGMLPEPQDLLAWLAHSQKPATAMRVLLAQPLDKTSLLAALENLFAEAPNAARLRLLGELAAQRPALAQEFNTTGQQFETPIPREDTFTEIALQIGAAEFAAYSGRFSKAVSAYSGAIKSSRQLQAQLAGRMASAACAEGDEQTAYTAWELATHLDPNNVELSAGQILYLASHGNAGEARKQIETATENLPEAARQHPDLLVAQAHLAHQAGDIPTVRRLVGEALERFPAADASQPGLATRSERAAALARLSLQLSLPRQAVQAAEFALAAHPDHPEYAQLAACAHQAYGDLNTAAAHAHLAVGLEPANLQGRRLLASILEAMQSWDQALVERQAVIAMAAPQVTDLHRLAHIAIRAGRAQLALATLAPCIDQNPEDGIAYALRGEARAVLGEWESALADLDQAILLHPDRPEPWLSLARIHTSAGQSGRALETLRAAAQAAPDLPEIHLALGEAYLADSAPTQALAALRRAAKLLEGHTGEEAQRLARRVSARLGDTLLQLGHLQEARQILDPAFTLTPADPEIAYPYARALILSGELQLALAPLQVTLEYAPQTPAPYLDYARCVLGLGQEAALDLINQAIEYLASISAGKPTAHEPQALLAELLAARKDYPAALQAYRAALESPLAEDPLWRGRLNRGLGETALKLGQIETALAALQAAQETLAADPAIPQALSEAYDAAGLAQDALEAARQVHRLASSDLERVLWYAAQVQNLQPRAGISVQAAYQEAASAYQAAINLAPLQGDLRVLLGELHQAHGAPQAARTSFESILPDDEGQTRQPQVQANPQVLYQAARGLLKLNSPASASRCLEQALARLEHKSSDSQPNPLDLWTALAAAEMQTGHKSRALEALDSAINYAPHEAVLQSLHLELIMDGASASDDPLSAAWEALPAALESAPHDPALRLVAARIERRRGDLSTARQQAELALEIARHRNQNMRARDAQSAGYQLSLQYPFEFLPRERDAIMSARLVAAELALASLDQAHAIELLAEGTPTEAANHEEMLAYGCLRAELALQRNKPEEALDEFLALRELDASHTRVLALQARLALRAGEHAGILPIDEGENNSTPGEILERSLEANRSLPASTRRLPEEALALAEAASELHQWPAAHALLEEQLKFYPEEARIHFLAARSLIWQTEYLQLCNAFDAQAEKFSLSDAALDIAAACWSALQHVTELLPDGHQVDLEHWRGRAQLAFWPQAALDLNAEKLGRDPGLSFAWLLHQVGQLSLPAQEKYAVLQQASRLARAHPNQPYIMGLLALLLESSHPHQALTAARAALELLHGGQGDNILPAAAYLHPGDAPFIQALVARLLFANPELADSLNGAYRAIAGALVARPDEPAWRILAARILLAKEDLGASNSAEIRAHLQAAISQAPENPAPHLMLGKLELDTHNYQAAISALEAACEAQPGVLEPWMLLAQAYWATGDVERAAGRAERAVTLASTQVEPLLLRGLIALDQGNAKGALSRAEAALRIDPAHTGAILLQSRALVSLGQNRTALAALETALPRVDDPLPLHIEHCQLLQASHGAAAALEELQNVLPVYPDHPDLLAVYARLLAETGRRPQAIQAAQRALRASGETESSIAPQQAELHRLLGNLLDAAGQLDQALNHLVKSAELNPYQVETFLALGDLYQKRRQQPAAIEAYHQAMQIAPQDARAYYQSALALKESKDYPEAEQMLRRACELAPEDIHIQRLLGAVVALNLVHGRAKPIHHFGKILDR